MSFTSVCHRGVPLGALVVLGGAVALWSQPAAPSVAAPVIGKSLRYCNPLPLPASSTDGRATGGQPRRRHGGERRRLYYLFEPAAAPGFRATSWTGSSRPSMFGGRSPVAPHVVKYNGASTCPATTLRCTRRRASWGRTKSWGPGRTKKASRGGYV